MSKSYEKYRRKRMSPEQIARNDARTQDLLEEMYLGEIRKALEITQHELAKRMGVSQANVSQIEGKTDWYLSTLRHTIESMGGVLEVSARFGDRSVKIDQRIGVKTENVMQEEM